jgi:PleD family two-component response regulator
LRSIVAASAARSRGADIVCTFSAGVDEFGDSDTLASVMARADAALYAAKANGKNCVIAAPSSLYRLVDPVDTIALNQS